MSGQTLAEALRPHWRTDCSESSGNMYVRWVRCRCDWESEKSATLVNAPDMHNVWNAHIEAAVLAWIAERLDGAREGVASDAARRAGWEPHDYDSDDAVTWDLAFRVPADRAIGIVRDALGVTA